jgi:hypothetical protein
MNNWQSRNRSDKDYYDNILKKTKVDASAIFEFDCSSSSS